MSGSKKQLSFYDRIGQEDKMVEKKAIKKGKESKKGHKAKEMRGSRCNCSSEGCKSCWSKR